MNFFFNYISSEEEERGKFTHVSFTLTHTPYFSPPFQYLAWEYYYIIVIGVKIFFPNE